MVEKKRSVVQVEPSDGPRKVLVDDAIQEIVMKPTWVFIACWLWATLGTGVDGYTAFMGVFTGYVPDDGLVCITDKCKDLYDAAKTADTVADFYTDLCDSGLIHKTDYTWELERTTFAVELDLYCDTFTMDLYESIYYVGAFLSIALGGWLYEALGRRKTAAIGAIVSALSTFLGGVVYDIEFLMFLRVMQGFGGFLNFTGFFIWTLELTPTKFRNAYNLWLQFCWCLSYPVLVLVCYTVYDWRMIHVPFGCIMVVMQLPILIFPDSPRYLVSIGKPEEALVALKRYARHSHSKFDLNNIILVNNDEGEDKSLPFWQQVVQFFHTPAMIVETLVSCFCWFVGGLLYYGLAYGWGEFGDDIYISYIYAGIAEAVGYTLCAIQIELTGRKPAAIFDFALAALCFFLGTIDHEFSPNWSLERIMSMAGTIFTLAAFSTIYLYATEMAPTTHRGKIVAASSLLARVSSFIGPLLSSIPGLSNSGKLCVFGAFSTAACLLFFIQPETKDMAVLETADEVPKRRREQGINSLGGMLRTAVGCCGSK